MIVLVPRAAVRRSPAQLVALWASFFAQTHAYYLRKQWAVLLRLCLEPTRLSHSASPDYINFFQRFYRNCGEVRTILRRRFGGPLRH